ncbi:MAG: aminopeptidase P family protein [Proteobacteria bacterium]|nr:aminopeptidase P family protein [Pseudomonadota bacterium]
MRGKNKQDAMISVDKKSRISALRELIKSSGIDGYVIPSTDEFHNEYVPQHLRRLEWLTGFTGSNGTAIITADHQVLYTDGRYLLQARKQLGEGWEVLDINVPVSCNWFAAIKNLRLGYDPMLHTTPELEYYNKLGKKYHFTMFAIQDLVDELKTHQQPVIEPPVHLEVAYSGQSSEGKLGTVLAAMHEDAEYLLITAPDSVSWLLNMRGYIVAYNPVVLAYILLHKSGRCIIFSDERITQTPHELRPLSEAVHYLTALLGRSRMIQCDPNSTPVRLAELCRIHQTDPCVMMKAIKNQVEQNGMRQAGAIDSAALCKFFYWLDKQLKSGNTVDELSAAQQLLQIRAEHPLFQMPSFSTISAFADNGAIIHYQPAAQSNRKLQGNGLYLLDSGGHYLCGTTDITRTLAIGQPTKEQRKYYTLVLKGHIALAHAVFPIGTRGVQLDALARIPLWREHSDYMHGTGHGVGHFLVVHEGPQRIGKSTITAAAPLKPGMVLSNEPGYYREGEYGIRLENLMLVQEDIKNANKDSGFLRFELLTYVPFDRKLIDEDMLDKAEKSWLAWYASQIQCNVTPYLNAAEQQWLEEVLG